MSNGTAEKKCDYEKVLPKYFTLLTTTLQEENQFLANQIEITKE